MQRVALNDDSLKVLREIRARSGVVRGWDLQTATRMYDGKQLVDAVLPLLQYDLVSASGNVSSPDDIASAVFTIPPSGISRVDMALKGLM
jgi:hypothetical protein